MEVEEEGQGEAEQPSGSAAGTDACTAAAGAEVVEAPEGTGSDDAPGQRHEDGAARGRVRGRKQKEPLLVAGKEVVGRQTGQHLIRYLERKEGEVKHEEAWVCLGATRFQWLTGLPPAAPPNPTHAGAPQREDAVGYKVKVFWPGMARWYLGKVVSYDPRNRMHKVKYRDGDIQELMLRHEAVQYLAREAREPGAGGGEAAPSPRAPRADPRRGRDRRRPAGAKPSPGGGKRPREEGSTDDPPSKSNKSSSTRDEGVVGPATASPLGPRAGGAPASGGGGSHDASAATAGSGEEDPFGSEELDSGELDSGDDSGMPSTSGGESDDLGSDAFLTEEEDSDFEVESYRRRRRSGGAPPKRPRRAGEGGRRGPGRPKGGARHRRGGDGGRPRGRREPASVRSFRPRVARSAEEEVVKSAGTSVVGARVAVFWPDSEAQPRGKLVQFDGYHKRHKVLYDDGQEEWVSLGREAFRWLSPRARSAGCTPNFRAAMAVLGADASPGRQLRSAGGDDGGAPRRGGAPAVGMPAPAPHGDAARDPPHGEACVGWQLSLLFDGDGQWYRGQVLGHDRRKGRHLVLYDDGEDEWVALEQESVTFHRPLAGGPAATGIYPGVLKGAGTPAGEVGVGWRVAVYWSADQVFYPGELVGYDAALGRYDVAYDDGDENSVSLATDHLKFVLPPGHRVDPERLDGAGALGLPRRRLGDDSDPDYEGEARPRAAPRRAGPRSAAAGPSVLQPWDAGEAPPPEASGVAGGGALGGGAARLLGLPGARGGLGGPLGMLSTPGAQVAPLVGEPVLARQVGRVPAFGCFAGEGEVVLPVPITVRIYASSCSAGSSLADAGAAAARLELPPSLPRGRERLEAHAAALENMVRRVGRAQQAVIKGVPTSLPPPPARPATQPDASAAGAGVAPAGAASVGGAPAPSSSCQPPRPASGLHRLARPSAVNYSPFSRRSHGVDSEEEQSSSSSGSSDLEGEQAGPLSPRSRGKVGKVRVLPGGQSARGGDQEEDSFLSAPMLPPSAAAQSSSPALLSPLKAGAEGGGGGAPAPPGRPSEAEPGGGLPRPSSVGLMPPLQLQPEEADPVLPLPHVNSVGMFSGGGGLLGMGQEPLAAGEEGGLMGAL
eukprot:scaffold3.g6200.t1